MIGRKRLKASELKKLEGCAFTSAAEYQYTWKGHAFFSNGGGGGGDAVMMMITMVMTMVMTVMTIMMMMLN